MFDRKKKHRMHTSEPPIDLAPASRFHEPGDPRPETGDWVGPFPPSASDDMHHSLPLEALLDPVPPSAALATDAFAPPPPPPLLDPPPDADPATELHARVRISESPMHLEPVDPDIERRHLDGRVDRFPAVTLEFSSVEAGGQLIPACEQIHVREGGESFWQVIPGPGRVWHEARDGAWCRASFPFTLGNRTDSVTYHGLALFAYRRRQIGGDGAGFELSPLRFQVSEGGIPYNLRTDLRGWGSAECRWEAPVEMRAGPDPNPHHDGRPLGWRGWSDLPPTCSRKLADTVHRGSGPDTVVINALATVDDIYATDGQTPWGVHPYPAAIRHGIWSASKSAGAGIAALHLAQRYGPEIFDLRVVDLLEVNANHDGWDDVRLRHCYDMASGIGDAGREPEPPCIFADYDIDPVAYPVEAERYQRWFAAPSKAERLEAVFRHPSYPWPPGTVARYRDQDFFTLTACLDALVKQREGPDASLWEMVCEAVYAPIGVSAPPVNRTREPDAKPGLPLLGGGLFLTVKETARIARLYHDQGVHAGQSLLHREKTIEATDPRTPKGLPTGLHTTDGEIRYAMGLWHLPYRTATGALLYLATMRGYGGNLVILLPNRMTAIRFAHDPPEVEADYDPLVLVRIADAIEPF